mgnify:CR=1 FL=1
MTVIVEQLKTFQNRKSETKAFKDNFSNLSNDEFKLLLFHSEKSFGSTFFLRKLQNDAMDHDIGIYLDCSEKSIDGFLRNTIFELGKQSDDFSARMKDKLNRFDEPSSMERSKNATISAIPYVGKSIREFTDSPKSTLAACYKVQASPNAILKIVSEEFPSEKLCVFLDNFNCIDNNQIDYLLDLVFFLNNKNTLIVACQNTSHVSNKSLVKLREMGFKVEIKKFNPLSPKDLKAIAKEKNINIDEIELVSLKNCDVYESLSYIYEKKSVKKKANTINGLSPISRYIVSVLIVSDQFISESFLYRCIESSTIVYSSNKEAVKAALLQLKNLGICEYFLFLNKAYYKVSSFIRGVLKRELPLPEVIIYTNEIYECLKRSLFDEKNLFSRISDCFLAFSLSLNINKAESGFWASKILTLSLANKGSFNLLEFIKDHLTPNLNYETFLLCLSGAMQEKNYQYFDEIFNKGDIQFQSRTEALLLKLIYENRLRNYQISDQYIKILNNMSLNKEIQLLVTSYKLINLFHSGKLKEARKLFKNNQKKLKNSQYNRYFLRIGAGMSPVKTGIAILEEIISDFVHKNDEFGLYTTKANLGAYYCKISKLNKGIELLESSYNELLVYGQENITHCGLSLATAYIQTGRYNNASTVLQKIISFPEDSHYALLAKYLLAEVYLLSGNTYNAINTFRQILPKVCKTSTQNIKTRFFINFGLAKAFMSEFDSELDELLILAEKHRANVLNSKWITAYQSIKNAINQNSPISLEEFNSLSLHGYFEYWWFNPLVILMEPYITFD